MAAGSPDRRTYADLLADSREGVTRTKAGAGALVGLIALCFGDLSANLVERSPGVLNGMFVTGIIVAGFFLVRSYIGYSNAETIVTGNTNLQTQIVLDQGEVNQRFREGGTDPAIGAVLEYRHARLASGIALGSAVLSVVSYLSSVWWGIV